MARIPMVTRTIEVMQVHVIGMNTNTKTVIEKDIEVTEKTEGEKLLKVVNRQYGTTEEIFISAVITGTTSTLYGMTEADFMKYAKVLPPR